MAKWRPVSYHCYKRTALSVAGPDMSPKKMPQQVLLAKCSTQISLFLKRSFEVNVCFLGGGSGLGDRQVGVWAATGEEVFGSDDFLGSLGSFLGVFGRVFLGGSLGVLG